MPILACEPIVPLMHLMTGASLAGGALMMKSLPWLFIAVAIKCVAFVVLEKRLTWAQAALFMLAANVLSTIPGFFVAACASSISGFFLAIPVMLFLGWLTAPRLRLALNKPDVGWLSGGAAAIGFMIFFFLSVALFEAAATALDRRNYAAYWVLKFLFVSIAVTAGLAISSVLEELVVGRLAREKVGATSFYRTVVRANYITLGFVLLVTALMMLPQRLKSPHFIVSWLHEFVSSLGLS